MTAKDLDPAAFGRDYFLGNESPLRDLYQYYTPLYRWIAAKLWILTGSFETGMVVLVPFAVSIYLAGMVLLLSRLTGNVWISLALALAATGIRPTMFQDYWGVGTSHFLPSLAAYAAIAPVLVYVYLIWIQKPKIRTGILFGLLLGLSANLHPTSALNLALLSGVLFLLESRFRKRAWKGLTLVAACTALGALPVFLHLLSNARVPFPSGLSAGDFRQAAHSIFQFPFRPERIELPGSVVLGAPVLEAMAWIYPFLGIVFLGLLFSGRMIFGKRERLLWLVCGLAVLFYGFVVALAPGDCLLFFLIAALYVVYLFRRGSLTFADRFSFGWMALVIFFSFETGYFLNLLWDATGLAAVSSFVIELPRAARFIYLPLFFLNGLAVAEGIRVLGSRLQRRAPGLFLPGTSSAGALLTLASALLLVFGAGFSRGPGENPLQWNMGVLTGLGVGLCAAAVICVVTRWVPSGKRIITWSCNAVFIFPLALIFFTPAGTTLSDFSPVPLPIFPRQDAEVLTFSSQNQGIVNWAATRSSPDALFFWCGLDHRRHLFFQADSGRGLTHSKRDYYWAFYTRGALVDFHRHYQRMTEACGEPGAAFDAAVEMRADYLLATRDWTAPDLPTCYRDDWYVVYGVMKDCPVNFGKLEESETRR